MDTYRYKEHCGPSEDDHLKYRNSKEVKFWQNKDPINYAKKLLKKNKITQTKIEKLEKEIELFVNKQFKLAESDKLPNYKEASKYVYA